MEEAKRISEELIEAIQKPMTQGKGDAAMLIPQAERTRDIWRWYKGR